MAARLGWSSASARLRPPSSSRRRRITRSAATASSLNRLSAVEQARQVVAQRAALELPGGEPGGVADRAAEQLSAAAEHVHRLGAGAAEPRLHLGGGQRAGAELVEGLLAPGVVDLRGRRRG